MDTFDSPERWPVTARRQLARGHIVEILEDDLTTPEGEPITREVGRHPGSGAILAVEGQERIAGVRQYRHPIGWRLLEIPAGLLDVADESPLHAAQRELAEEAQLSADNWSVLVDYFNSPGISDEQARIFLATGLHTAPVPEGFVAHGEEVDMGLDWIAIDDVLAAIDAGEVQNGAVVNGTLAYFRAKITGVPLRPGDTPWRALTLRDKYRHE
jgi:ADP-ribose pyrophosphatase